MNNDVISRDAILSALKAEASKYKIYEGVTLAGLYVANSIIKKIPAVDPVVHGEWQHLGGDEWRCTRCGFAISTEGSWEHPLENDNKYCKNCGAKMDGGVKHAAPDD